MVNYSGFFAALLAGATAVAAQSVHWTDPRTGISLEGFRQGDYSFGVAFPTTANTTNEFIGQLVGPRAGWAGVSFGGGMAQNLLLVAWENANSIVSGFRIAPSYTLPQLYNQAGPQLEPICTTGAVNNTHFALTFICRNCHQWRTNNNQQRGFQLTAANTMFGHARHSWQKPFQPTNPGSSLGKHDSAGQFNLNLANARSANYEAFKGCGIPQPVPTFV